MQIMSSPQKKSEKDKEKWKLLYINISEYTLIL